MLPKSGYVSQRDEFQFRLRGVFDQSSRLSTLAVVGERSGYDETLDCADPPTINHCQAEKVGLRFLQMCPAVEIHRTAAAACKELDALQKI